MRGICGKEKVALGLKEYRQERRRKRKNKKQSITKKENTLKERQNISNENLFEVLENENG